MCVLFEKNPYHFFLEGEEAAVLSLHGTFNCGGYDYNGNKHWILWEKEVGFVLVTILLIIAVDSIVVIAVT